MGLLGSNNPQLTALWQLRPDQACKIVVSTLRHVNGDITKAARLLKVGRTTLWRWVTKYPELREALDRIRMQKNAGTA